MSDPYKRTYDTTYRKEKGRVEREERAFIALVLLGIFGAVSLLFTAIGACISSLEEARSKKRKNK